MNLYRRRTPRSKFRIKRVETWRLGLAKTAESEQQIMLYISAGAEVVAIEIEPNEAMRLCDELAVLARELMSDK